MPPKWLGPGSGPISCSVSEAARLAAASADCGWLAAEAGLAAGRSAARLGGADSGRKRRQCVTKTGWSAAPLVAVPQRWPALTGPGCADTAASGRSVWCTTATCAPQQSILGVAGVVKSQFYHKNHLLTRIRTAPRYRRAHRTEGKWSRMPCRFFHGESNLLF